MTSARQPFSEAFPTTYDTAGQAIDDLDRAIDADRQQDALPYAGLMEGVLDIEAETARQAAEAQEERFRQMMGADQLAADMRAARRQLSLGDAEIAAIERQAQRAAIFTPVELASDEPETIIMPSLRRPEAPESVGLAQYDRDYVLAALCWRLTGSLALSAGIRDPQATQDMRPVSGRTGHKPVDPAKVIDHGVLGAAFFQTDPLSAPASQRERRIR